MAETNPNKPTSKTSQIATNMDEFELFKNQKALEFATILKPSILKQKVTIRKNTTLEEISNPNKPTSETFRIATEINVSEFFKNPEAFLNTGNEVSVMLRLKSAGLEEFQCTKPMKKMLPLWGRSLILRASDDFNTECVAFFFEEGSNWIPFQCVASVVVEMMKWSFWESFESASGIADNCSVCLIRDPDKFVMLRFKLGEFGDMVYLNNADFISVPDLPSKGSLESASGIADDCSVCVIKDTDKSILLMFQLDEFGDKVYLNAADFISVPDLLFKDFAHIDLEEADVDYQKFINLFYMYKTVVPSKALPTMMTKLPEDFTNNGAQSVEMMLRPEEYKIKRGWSFWKSLESASGIAENCSVCLIGDPDKLTMLEFKQDEFGDKADFISVPDLLCKDSALVHPFHFAKTLTKAKKPLLKDKHPDMLLPIVRLIIFDYVNNIGIKLYEIQREEIPTREEFYATLEDYRTIHEFNELGVVVYPWNAENPFQGYETVYCSGRAIITIEHLTWPVFRLVLTTVYATMLLPTLNQD